uniref:Uncharacterized protein n=1 Tax=Setaria viridis TaxID=4556 RepID=A0A4U6UWN6_SETVI|nr:hypothetical protein SEVIR_4G187301v2 [Setaria viridis]
MTCTRAYSCTARARPTLPASVAPLATPPMRGSHSWCSPLRSSIAHARPVDALCLCARSYHRLAPRTQIAVGQRGRDSEPPTAREGAAILRAHGGPGKGAGGGAQVRIQQLCARGGAGRDRAVDLEVARRGRRGVAEEERRKK